MTELTRDGVRLVYEVTGTGEQAIMFVHGWTSDRSYFEPQIARFSGDLRCVTVDLRGHGQSDAPEQDYTVEGFADDVAAVCDDAGVKNALLVGHSMGGAIALELAARRSDLARAVAMLDPAILFPPEGQALMVQLAGVFGAPGGMDALRQFESDRFFLATSDAALKKRIVDAASKTAQHVVASAFKAIAAYDAGPALSSVKAPLLYVGAEPPIADLARLRELAPGVSIGNTVGSGHFHQLEVPEQINAMLDRFFAIVG